MDFIKLINYCLCLNYTSKITISLIFLELMTWHVKCQYVVM